MKNNPGKLNKGDRFHKILMSCPFDTEDGKCILKIFGIINRKDFLRSEIVLDYQSGRKSRWVNNKISIDDFEKFLSQIPHVFLEQYFDDPDQHYEILDLSDGDNLESQLKKMEELDAIKTYNRKEFNEKIQDIQRQKFNSEILH